MASEKRTCQETEGGQCTDLRGTRTDLGREGEHVLGLERVSEFL